VTDPLVCPSCASTHSLDERFCPTCGMPLVYSGRTGDDEPVSAAHERARKIKPQFTEGELVRVVSAQHQAEAEMVQGILLEEGIPSMTRRSAGFDVPDMLAAGRRDILVPASGLSAGNLSQSLEDLAQLAKELENLAQLEKDLELLKNALDLAKLSLQDLADLHKCPNCGKVSKNPGGT